MRDALRFALATALCLGCSDPAPTPPADAAVADTSASVDTPSNNDTGGPSTEEAITVTAPSGALEGRVDSEGVARFLGVPYAAPPVGALRWRAPAPAAPVTGVRMALRKGAACPQAPGMLRGNAPISEDCLSLNVWAPASAVRGAGRLPVMVFIHGGGFTAGSVWGPEYDGQRLAARGVVLVNFNYRLGQLGFLAHPRFADETGAQGVSGNYGTLDQQAALRWVRDNIAQLGGDPNNVTLFGESAGSISVCSQMVSPLARGLFHRAISQSAPCSFLITPMRDADAVAPVESAEALARRFAAAAGCGDAGDVAACLRALPMERVLSTLPVNNEIVRYSARYQPNVDGVVLRELPWQSFLMGRIAPVPFLSGTNRDEGTAFTFSAPVNTEAAYREAVAALVPGHETEVVSTLYPVAQYGSPNAAWTAFLADAVFVCPARAQARLVAAAGQPSYLYHFTRVNRAGTSLGLGVFHTAELPYVFGNFTGLFSRGEADGPVVEATQGYWVRFARTGDPNGEGATRWPPLTATGDDYLDIGDTVRAAAGLHAQRCDAIARWITP
ncbi:MAG: carboxylesterase family protein [Myxococcales bacterium]|nr:carboxylesterase family protein [Myxococcales bacterium]